MTEPDENIQNTELATINFQIPQSLVEEMDEAWRDRGYDSRWEFIEYALHEAVNHPEGAGLWKDIAISEAQFDEVGGISSDAIKAMYGLGGE